MSADLFRMVYCSRNTIPDHQGDAAAELAGILAVSRANNARDGVTGALLYSEGCFAQVLEGELAAVERTFERIQCDPRHGEVVVLEAGRVEQRLFGAWDMALAECADPAEARAALGRALAAPTSDAGTAVLALLDGLVRREADWVRSAV